MPARAKGEALNHYIGRFVSDPTEERHFPELKQRLKVAYVEARETDKKRKRKSAHAS